MDKKEKKKVCAYCGERTINYCPTCEEYICQDCYERTHLFYDKRDFQPDRRKDYED